MNRQAVVETSKVVILRTPGTPLAMSSSESLVAPDANGILDLTAQALHPPGCPCCSINKSKAAPDPSQSPPAPEHVAVPTTPPPAASSAQPVADTHHEAVPTGAFLAVSMVPATPAAPAMADIQHIAAVMAPNPHVAILGGLGEHLHF